MDINSILQLGSQLFGNKLDTNGDGALDMNDAGTILYSLMGGNDGSVNLGNLQERAQENGLGSLFASWLGDGENMPISIEQVTAFISSDKINEIASQFGISPNSVLSGLQEALPAMVDKASKGGSFIEGIQSMFLESDGLKKLFS